MRHLLDLFDVTSAEIEHIFAIAEDLKSRFLKGVREPLLPGRVMALLFDKPSLRTRVSFETAMAHLGGNSLFLGDDVGWGKRESIADFSRVLSSYVDVIVCRTFAHQRVEELAAHATCAVVNGLTDEAHPCQALADLFTLREARGKLAGLTLAFVGDGNNVARSLAVACAKTGMRFVLAAPKGYEFPDGFVTTLQREVPGASIEEVRDPIAAVKNAAAVYTDVWTSMGQETERAARLQAFAPYQVNGRLMKAASREAVFLHCLPAHRGEEVTDEVIDGPQSLVVPEAANRMHVQKGLLAWLLASKG